MFFHSSPLPSSSLFIYPIPNTHPHAPIIWLLLLLRLITKVQLSINIQQKMRPLAIPIKPLIPTHRFTFYLYTPVTHGTCLSPPLSLGSSLHNFASLPTKIFLHPFFFLVPFPFSFLRIFCLLGLFHIPALGYSGAEKPLFWELGSWEIEKQTKSPN